MIYMLPYSLTLKKSFASLVLYRTNEDVGSICNLFLNKLLKTQLDMPKSFPKI